MSTYDLFSPLKDKDAKELQFRIEKTATGQWRTYEPPKNGKKSKKKIHFREFVSDLQLFGRPLVHIANGIDPRTEKRAMARGIIAIGQCASGVVAIGQMATGYVAIGQLAIGRVAAIGQLAIAPLVLGQMAVGALMIGQMIYGGWGLSLIHI